MQAIDDQQVKVIGVKDSGDSMAMLTHCTECKIIYKQFKPKNTNHPSKPKIQWGFQSQKIENNK